MAATVNHLLDFDLVSDTALEDRLESLALDLTKLQDLQRWWLVRMVYSKRPLQEKMTLFWHGLLTSGHSKVGRAERMWTQNDLFRRQALGSFSVLLKAVSRDPAMLVWLDSQTNRKAAPNENFARELMELFSMGVGTYTETDVRESSRAFTGWFLNNRGFFFNAAEHDNGIKSFLGQSGNFDGDDVIDIIAAHSATSLYICRKLFEFFAYDNPEPSMLVPLQSAFQTSGGSIKSVVRAILLSDAFYSQKAYRSRPRSPVELVAGTLRTLEIETDGRGLSVLLGRMGQTIFDPPNVAGWPGGPTWINSSTLLERINAANRFAIDRKAFLPASQLQMAGLTSNSAVAYYLALLADGAMPAEERAELDGYAQGLLKSGDQDAALRTIVFLVMASPDHQLA